MAENVIEVGPGALASATSTSIDVQDNVRSIPQNKNIGNTNYYSGTVGIKCIVNGFCPVFRKFVVDESVVLNDETLKTFPEEDVRNLNSVPGLPGIYLRERYNYLSNFLQINGLPATGNYITEETQSTANFTYTCEQTFNAINSVFDDKNEEPLDGFSQTVPTNLGKRANWRYVRYNEATDSNNKERDILVKNTGEYKDSGIQYIAAVAASATNVKGIHWKAEKVTQLFQGEDFFIAFRQTAIATDTSNIGSIAFLDRKYDYLDVSYNEKATTDYPANAAIVGYKKKIADQESGEGKTITIETYEKDLDTMKFFDFNKQAYYVIEIGPSKDGDILFIIITQKSYPTAVLYAGKKTYNLGSYTNIKGDDLIKMPKWTIQVRNHLGYLVVAFNGDTKQPWIISPPGTINELIITGINYTVSSATGESKGRVIDKLVVPAAKLSVWGGNLAAAFCFSPLTYANHVQLNLPPQNKKSSSSKDPKDINKYELPLKGTASARCTVADSDSGIDGQVVANVFEKKPIYSSDVQIVRDVSFTINNTNVTASTFPFSIQSYFSLTKEYLKAIGGIGRPNNVTEKPDDVWASRIELEAKSVQPKNNNETFSFIIQALLTAGDHDFVGTSTIQTVKVGDIDPDADSNMAENLTEQISYASCAKDYHLYSCKTPVLTQLRLVADPSKEADGWATNPIDVSDLVLKYDENYTSSDFHTMNHTGTITFLMNKTVKYSDLVEKLEGLRTHAFYLEVWGGYTTCNYTRLPANKGFKLFTGICYGGVLEEKAGERTMTCQILDYTQILKDSYIFNSPFFDGMRDVCAVYKLVGMVGLKDTGAEGGGSIGSVNGAKFGPAYLCKLQAENDTPVFKSTTPDGRGSFSTTYVLPNSYARLTAPYYKFQDGTSYWSALEQITKKAGKVMFFDSYGIFHYENLPYDEYLFGNGNPDDVKVLWKFTTTPFGSGQLVFDVLVRELSVIDVFNIIHLMTATPDRELAIWDEVNWDSLYKTNSSGFLGYKKLYFQQDGIFGSLNTLEKLAQHYKTKFFKPPAIYRFQSYGVPMRCFDIVSVNDEKLIVTSISNNFDPKKNIWWQTTEAEWYGSEENFKNS